jgi:DNA polymerase-3 subunit epsilon/ATP-dependent DNA helicase DinG
MSSLTSIEASAISPFEQVCVALDLETTGLDSTRDTIMEVGAVKFQGDEVLDTLQTFVNPGRPIPEHIQRLTHISPSQVRRAPFFSSVADRVADFVADCPVIGHNVTFDLNFLASHGVPLDNPAYDTWDLASMLLPRSMQYSLRYLSEFFGIDHSDPHRALSDAKATQGIFLALVRRAAVLDPGLTGYIAGLAHRSNWALTPVFRGLEGGSGGGLSALGLNGLDRENLGARLSRPEKRRADGNAASVDPSKIGDFLGSKGPFASVFPGFENRPEQEEMLAAVTEAIYGDRHLVVEGGTGVGKSMAYLLPAALFAASKGKRVVISTNTINLQEQLLTKDIPALLEVLEGEGVISPGSVQAALLKGRSNYLCLRRWDQLARGDSPSVDDARLLGKTAVWLQETASGDRSEINLSGRDAFTWSRVSASDRGHCPGQRDGSPCFLRAARERADQADIVVVNHALLMADLVRGGGVIPDYQYLVIDEAHNHGLRVAAHIFALEDAKNLLRAGIDVFAHSVRDQDIDDEFVQLFLGKPLTVQVPNLPNRGVATDLSWLAATVPADRLAELQANAVDNPERQEGFGIQARNLARLSEEGVRIAFGTDGGTPWQAHVELADMVAAGVSPADVIVAATSTSAALMGLTDAGTLEAGKTADFMVLEADPLQDITNTRRIVSFYLRGAEVDRAGIAARLNPPAAQ